jgi:hypothetical protein
VQLVITPKQEATVSTKPAKSLAEAAVAIGKLPPNTQYKSVAALVEAAAPGTPRSIATLVRGVFRNTDNGVGRGNRYSGVKPTQFTRLYKQLQAARSQAKAAKSSGSAAKKAVKA